MRASSRCVGGGGFSPRVWQGIVAAGAKYELRTAFPARPLVDTKQTLEGLGLTPSATLCVRMMSEGRS